MSTEVRLPELGENVTQGDLVRILVHVGDTIEKDQPIVELETEKAAIEVPAPAAGKVTEIRAHEGQKLKVGETILVLESNGAGGKKPEAKAAAPAPAKPAPAPESRPQPAPAAAAPSGNGAQGARIEIKLPELGENVAGGDLTRFLVQVGDTIDKDQPIAEVETEKAVVEVPSPEAGKVLELKAREKQKVKIGETLLVLQASGAAAAKAEPRAPAPPVRGTADNVRQEVQAADRMDTHEGAGVTPSQIPESRPVEADRGTPAHWEPVPAPRQVGPSGLSPSDVPA
ncbi:MAG TPA: biotin/lipoyl-containing protein, partial [Terriglobales bacterium]|nr:biotin/lipoyl-containing protein [Terriglobales bacterium]